MKHCSKCGEMKLSADFNKNQNYCRECQSAYRKKYWEENRSVERAAHAAYYHANKAKRNEQYKQWYEKNRDVVIPRKRNYYALNCKNLAEQNRARVKAWRQDNKYLKNAAEARRKAAKLRATPQWAAQELINSYYETAAGLSMLLGEWYHVDHIVPLQNQFVCGLHVEHNLRVIPGIENLKKGNRHWPDMPNQHENKLSALIAVEAI